MRDESTYQAVVNREGANPWFIVFRRDACYPRLRLFCFPYAGGGSSSFRNWAEDLPPGVEVWAVVPPGRASRLSEHPYRRLAPLVDSLTDAIRPHLGLPSLFFGHSLGALAAYEVACSLRACGAGEPSCLLVSGHRAPHLPDRRPPGHTLPDSGLVAEIRRLGGASEDVLGNPELLELLLPTLRSDLEVAETYSYVPREPLRCPILAFGGEADPRVSPEELRAWRGHTTNSFLQRTFPGGHFYLYEERPALLASVSAEIRLISS